MRQTTSLLLLLYLSSLAAAEDWPQFRGPGGSAVSDAHPLPADLDNPQRLLWKRPVPPGHSSPVVVGNKLLLTALRDNKLLTVALAADNGQPLWEVESEFEKLESTHRIGSPATATVASDGQRAYSFFGSSGLTAMDLSGAVLWRLRLGPFDNEFGAASSPLLMDNLLITWQDHDTGAYLAAYDKLTGEQVWRESRSSFRRNYGSPVVWNSDAGPQIVVAGTAQVTAYDARTGELVWLVRGLCRVVSNTPVVGGDGRLYVAATGGGSAGRQPAFADLLATADKNANGRLEQAELPGSPIKSFFGQFDRDGDKSLDAKEYESIREVFSMEQSRAIAIRPGGRGDISESHVAWSYGKSMPRNSSPLWYRGRLFWVNDGGILVCLDAETGSLLKQSRLEGSGKSFSSPVAGDGKLYVASDRGNLNVVAADDSGKQLSLLALGEGVMATPAIANGRLYVRGADHLFCFGTGP